MKKKRFEISPISKDEFSEWLLAAELDGFKSLSAWVVYVIRRYIRAQNRRVEASWEEKQ